MNLLHHGGILGKGLCGPQSVIQIESHLFQSRGHRSINYHNSGCIQYVLQGSSHVHNPFFYSFLIIISALLLQSAEWKRCSNRPAGSGQFMSKGVYSFHFV